MRGAPRAPRPRLSRHSSASGSATPEPRLEPGSGPMQSSVPLPSPAAKSAARTRPRRRIRLRWFALAFVLLLLGVAALLVDRELRTSELQARELSRIAREATFQVGDGPSASIRFPSGGPYDERLGYTQVPDFVARLSAAGFGVERPARHSDRLIGLEDWGINPVYPEKARAGLSIVGRDGRNVFSASYPGHSYGSFADVPTALVEALAFVENREVLDDRYPKRNPAIEWDRLGRAPPPQPLESAGRAPRRPGASTRATP